MERGEEEAVRAAAMHFSAAIFADEQARSFRRAAAENCRPAIFEARATLREQSGSTLGRRVYAPVCPRLLGIEECPHYFVRVYSAPQYGHFAHPVCSIGR